MSVLKKIKQLEPMEIEKRSFEIISHELSEMQITLPADQEMITKRVIHTSADFDYIQTLKYSKDAVAIAKRLISEGADIVTDTNMALSGINKKYLAKFGGQAHCFMADDEVALIANARGSKHGVCIKDRKACNFCDRKCTDSAYRAVRYDRKRNI